jgi:hypothetical protein
LLPPKTCSGRSKWSRSSSRWTRLTASAVKFTHGDRQITSAPLVSSGAPYRVQATKSS